MVKFYLILTSVSDLDPPDLSSSKNSKKNLDFYCFVTSFGLFIFENDGNVPVPSKSNKQKTVLKLVFCWRLEGR